MTSKQALLEIYLEAQSNQFHFTNEELVERVNKISNDLEVLEIIKSHIVNKTFIMGSDYDDCNTIQFEVCVKELKPFIQEDIKSVPIKVDNNSFTLIREWLENDK